MRVYRDNLGRFRPRRHFNNEFAGKTLELVYPPRWPVHAIISGLRTVYVLSQHPGITFEEFRKLGGSASRLRRMVKHGAALAA